MWSYNDALYFKYLASDDAVLVEKIDDIDLYIEE